MSNDQHLYDLLDALVEGTRSGRVRWNRADARGQAWITEGRSGTVIFTAPPIFGPGVSELTVKDRTGNTVDSLVPGPLQMSTGAGTYTFRDLQDAIEAQRTGPDSVVRKLTSEFGR